MQQISYMFKVVMLFLSFQLPMYSQISNQVFLFVGSYTNGVKGDGIHVYSFDQENGKLELTYKEADLINSSFLAVSPNGSHLYAATETQLQKEGSVSSFKINPVNGSLTFLNKKSAGGRNPVHINIHPNGQFLVNSNYTDAGVSLLPINTDGSLEAYSQLFTFTGSSVLQPRQNEAHVHSSSFSIDGQFLVVMDLGTDEIYRFRLDQSEEKNNNTLIPLESIKTSLGDGPRHFVFHPSGRFGFVVNELIGTVTSYTYNDGELTFLQNVSCYEEGVKIFQSADIHCSPDGKFLYVSNRGAEENSIAIFSFNEQNGKLVAVGRTTSFGEHPRSFIIDPSGNYLIVANQFTNNLVVFRRDVETGLLTKTDNDIDVGAPSSLKMFKY